MAALFFPLSTSVTFILSGFCLSSASPNYQWCKAVFNKFEFGTFERIILLCQFEPFGQFLDDELKEIRLEKKRKRGKSGKYVTKRIAFNKFHSCLGKAVKPWSSGKKKGHIVTGSTICRSHLHLWADRNIVKNKRNDGIFQDLREQYKNDMKTSYELVESLKLFPEKELEKLKVLLEKSPAGQVLLNVIDEAIKEKKNPIKTVQSKGRANLGRWAVARISDDKVERIKFCHNDCLNRVIPIHNSSI